MKDEIRLIDAYEKSDLSLYERVQKSEVFMIFATPIYMQALKEDDENVIDAKKIAEELKKPSVILIDRRLSEKEIKEVEEHIKGLNVIRKEVIDIFNTRLVAKIINEVHTLYGRMNDNNN